MADLGTASKTETHAPQLSFILNRIIFKVHGIKANTFKLSEVLRPCSRRPTNVALERPLEIKRQPYNLVRGLCRKVSPLTLAHHLDNMIHILWDRSSNYYKHVKHYSEAFFVEKYVNSWF